MKLKHALACYGCGKKHWSIETLRAHHKHCPRFARRMYGGKWARAIDWSKINSGS